MAAIGPGPQVQGASHNHGYQTIRREKNQNNNMLRSLLNQGSTVSNTEFSELFGLTEFRGENSVSSSQPIICVPKRTHQVFFAELTEFGAGLSGFHLPKQYSRNSIPPPLPRFPYTNPNRTSQYNQISVMPLSTQRLKCNNRLWKIQGMG